MYFTFKLPFSDPPMAVQNLFLQFCELLEKSSSHSRPNFKINRTHFPVRVRFSLKWSGQRDSNSRPSAPKADALPGCAMPRRDTHFLPIDRRGDNTRRFSLRQLPLYALTRAFFTGIYNSRSLPDCSFCSVFQGNSLACQ